MNLKDKVDAIIDCIVKNDVSGLEKEFALGLDPNELNKSGRSILNWACQEGNLEIVSFLINVGANVNGEDKSGFTPLATASGEGHTHIVAELLSRGASPEVRVKAIEGNALHSACAWGHPKIVMLLVNTGKVDVNLRDGEGVSPIEYAARGGHSQIVSFLNSKGTNSSRHVKQNVFSNEV